MSNKFFAAALSLVLVAPAFGQAAKEVQRVQQAANVLREIVNIPDDIPKDLLDKAACVLVFPSVKKAAFVVGGSYGRGVISCRSGKDFRGPWGAPAMYALEAGSVGFQIGASATDFVLLVMNDGGARSIMTSKVKLGGDASIAAGPVGRSASAATDIVLRAQLLSYSRSRGLFAGVSLQGSTLRSDNDANKNLYGRDLSAQDIVIDGAVKAPAGTGAFQRVLQRRSPKRS